MGKKTKQSKAPTTAVTLVLDETGSMHPTAGDTIGAVNGYLDTLAEETPDALITVTEFSDMMGGEPKFRVLAAGVKAADAPRLNATNYRPRGNTPLYDAIGKAIRETEQVKADRYLLVVMTDGQENASTEWELDGIRKLIEQKQGEAWTIVYLGANQDAWHVGMRMGVHAGSTMSYAQTASGVMRTNSALAAATVKRVTADAAATLDFFGDAGQTAEDYEDPQA